MTNEMQLYLGDILKMSRRIVGGKDLNGIPIPAADAYSLGLYAERLRKALDEYDRLMLAEMDKRR